MSKKRNPLQESSQEAQKLKSLNTRGKNAAGQTNGQWERDQKKRTGHFTGAGEAPLMKK
jgi:hypothetical protein